MSKKLEQIVKDFTNHCKDIINGGSDHFWISLDSLGYYGLWITGEGAKEDGKVYVCAYLTDKIDSLGYCYGPIYADGYPDEKTNDIGYRKYVEYLVDCAQKVVDGVIEEVDGEVVEH